MGILYDPHNKSPACPLVLQISSGLLQVSYDEELSRTNRWTFLKDMHRSNVVLWPEYSHNPVFAVIPHTFLVVEHVVMARDIDENYGDEVDEDGEEH